MRQNPPSPYHITYKLLGTSFNISRDIHTLKYLKTLWLYKWYPLFTIFSSAVGVSKSWQNKCQTNLFSNITYTYIVICVYVTGRNIMSNPGVCMLRDHLVLVGPPLPVVAPPDGLSRSFWYSISILASIFSQSISTCTQSAQQCSVNIDFHTSHNASQYLWQSPKSLLLKPFVHILLT